MICSRYLGLACVISMFLFVLVFNFQALLELGFDYSCFVKIVQIFGCLFKFSSFVQFILLSRCVFSISSVSSLPLLNYVDNPSPKVHLCRINLGCSLLTPLMNPSLELYQWSIYLSIWILCHWTTLMRMIALRTLWWSYVRKESWLIGLSPKGITLSELLLQLWRPLLKLFKLVSGLLCVLCLALLRNLMFMALNWIGSAWHSIYFYQFVVKLVKVWNL